nr:23S rRNA (adenine(2503)-C(2))-methyltransferase RlmN [Desulfobulbaceae bacterium]
MSLNHSELIDLKDLSLNKLIEVVSSLDESPFRAKQIFSWLYRPGIRKFEQMTDISKQFRAKLDNTAYFSQLALHKKEISTDGTIKYAFMLSDDHIVESVLIPEGDRNTLCVSSQVGCAMGCKFCLTGTMGLKRNLTPAEIVNQVYYVAEELLAANSGKVTNIVFMGMGEPLANFNHLMTALSILSDNLGLNFSDRKMTVSTCGIVPKIIELGQKCSVNMAISLHAADDRTRNSIMPVNLTYSLDSLITACREFPLSKRKPIMFEYILLKDVNDSAQHAKELIKLLHGIPCKINLLPYNSCPALPFQKPLPKTIETFHQILRKAGHTVIIRDSRGADISAACGQLAQK